MPVVGHALVTGAAGFIGSNLVDRLLAAGWKVSALDSMDPFYPRSVKEVNIASHIGAPGYRFIEGDILDAGVLRELASDRYDAVIHLAAKAGVRPSIADPVGYHRANVTGTASMLAFAAEQAVPHFILASSSSVYGECPAIPWKETEWPLEPISPYASTKLEAEKLARDHVEQQGGRVTVLRFFTAYGPRQRPDLAIHRFVHAIHNGLPISIYGDGSTQRDYTYVDDIVQGIIGALGRSRGGDYAVYNLGNSATVALSDLVSTIEEVMGREAIIQRMPEQPGDVPRTCADISRAAEDLGYRPNVQLAEGLERFLQWYGSRALVK